LIVGMSAFTLYSREAVNGFANSSQD
jgi:hypothetical protein